MQRCTCDPCRRLAKFVRLDPDARAYQERWHGDDADAVLGMTYELRDRLRGRDIEIKALEEEAEDLRARLDEALDGLRAKEDASLVRDLETELRACGDELEACKREVNELRAQVKDLEGEIARLRDEIEEWREGVRVP